MPDQFATQHDHNIAEAFNSPQFDKTGAALALSGGGYKAAAYHLGALLRLNQIGWLPKLKRISSVSGGSIAAAYLGLKWSRLGFDAKGVGANFDTEFVAPMRDFLTEVNLDVSAGALGLLLPFRSAGDQLAKGYDKHLFKGATLQDLPAEPAAPRFVLLSTNYELNSLWRFARAYAADYRVGRIEAPSFPLARIVAASSAFPPFFCPLELDMRGQTILKTPGADHNGGTFAKRALLADGGVYDNLALEPVWKRYGTLLVSNSGAAFDEDQHPENWFGLMLRIIGMMHRQAENNRQRSLMILARLGERKVAYWPLRNDGVNYPVKSKAAPGAADIKAAQEEHVRLWSLGAKAFARLANHGYALCDAAMRSHIDPAPAAPAVAPFPV